jgi:hypothetical protein
MKMTNLAVHETPSLYKNMIKELSCIETPITVEEQTRKNSNFPVRGIFKNPREIIVNIFR